MNLTLIKKNKNTLNSETITLNEPDEIFIPLKQGDCEECTPCVKTGDRVKIGDIVGKPVSEYGVPVHSGVSGLVTEITESGDKCAYVRIKSDGLQYVSDSVVTPVIGSKQSLIEAVRASGLCGQSGAGLPTHMKLSTDKKIDTLIVNCCECEPYITSDHREIIEKSDDIKTGAGLVTKYLDIPHCIFALPKGEREAADILRAAALEINGGEVRTVPAGYPNGSDKVLAYLCTKRRIKASQSPDDQGLLILNVSTVGFIGRYSKDGMPLVKRRVTVDGSAVRTPCNVYAVIGTPVSQLLEFADCRLEAVWHILSGGPMMGKEIDGISSPVTKTMNAITASTEPIRDKKYIEANRVTNCFRCGRCVEACPVGLIPNLLETAFDKGNVQKLRKLHNEVCLECGACSYVCPAKRELTDKIARSKQLTSEPNDEKEGGI